MSEAPHVLHTLKVAPRGDVAVLLVCLLLTVLFDMVLAVGVGLLLAAGLFIGRMSALTDAVPVEHPREADTPELPPEVAAFSIRGPLFFGAADRALGVLRRFNPRVRIVLLDISAVPLLDMTAISTSSACCATTASRASA